MPSSFHPPPPEATLRISTLEQSPDHALLAFALTDKGIGLAEEHFEKIFEPLTQVDGSITRQYDGIGIGLSLCKQLVALMGGQIGVNSALGKGSTFYFTIRVSKQGREEPFDMRLLQALKAQPPISADQKDQLIVVDTALLSPMLMHLNQVLAESNVTSLLKILPEIKKYQIPKRKELLQKIGDYRFDEAVLVLQEIASEIGVKL